MVKSQLVLSCYSLTNIVCLRETDISPRMRNIQVIEDLVADGQRILSYVIQTKGK